MWDAFSSRLTKLVKKFVPVRTVRSRQRPIWMTSEILQAIKRKRRLWKDAKRGKNQEQYAEAENRVRKLIRNAKRNFEKRLSNGNGETTGPSTPTSSRKPRAALPLVHSGMNKKKWFQTTKG
jgi:hypothetical protein